MLETVDSIRDQHKALLTAIEWTFTILFSIEYVTRILSVHKPLKYIFSFYGLVDFLSIIPTYLSFFFAGAQYFIVIRSLRLLRVFRVLKLARYLGEGEVLLDALKQSRAKVTVFLGAVFTVVVMMGSLMYVLEGAEAGFTSIPKSMYWAIVTLTTVGYGDIAPQTPLGQMFSAALMILGYGVIAVPTGIVTAEMTRAVVSEKVSTQACQSCSSEGHDSDAKHCKYCGHQL
jgi:voltage-gated potassium channel